MVPVRRWDPATGEWIEHEIHLDGYLKANLDAGVDQLHKDFDQLWFIDGSEGSGKSELGITSAYYVNREDTRHTLIDRICLTAEDFTEAIKKAKQFEAVVLDEAYGAMSSSGAMSQINRLLQKTFTEIRAKNLFVFIIAPSFMDIQRYFALWRSKCLLHVYLGKGNRRGFCGFYSALKKRKLYIMGKKQFYNYKVVSPNFIFHFTMQSKKCIDASLYKQKKMVITNSKTAPILTESQMRKQMLIEWGLKAEELGDKGLKKLTAAMMGVHPSTLSYHLKNAKEKLEKPKGID